VQAYGSVLLIFIFYIKCCRFVWYQNIRSASFSFVTIYACDRQTDRQDCDSNSVHCIAWGCPVINWT